MAITSSTYTLDGHAQVDGRRYVRETHTDSDGQQHVVEYLAPAGWTDVEYAATMQARAAQLAESLAESEFDQILGSE
jgi:broad specificity phosphatase PhoE